MSIKSLTSFFFTCAVAAAFVLTTATSGQAITKCKAKVDRKTGVISYTFKYTSAGPVQFAYENYGPPSTHTDQTLYSFSNEDSCQTNGKGKACRVSADPDLAAIAPNKCKTYLYDTADDTTCETRVPYCQVATRPPPNTGYHCIENNHETTAAWDAATGHAWHISSDHQPRSLEDHHEHLKHLNGTHVDLVGDPDHTPLVHSADLELPTLHQLKHLAQDCADLFHDIGGVAGTPNEDQECLHTLCGELWPDPTDPENCAWSRTADATQPSTHAHAICLVDTGGASRPGEGLGGLRDHGAPYIPPSAPSGAVYPTVTVAKPVLYKCNSTTFYLNPRMCRWP
jgi:hypothetical protein